MGGKVYDRRPLVVDRDPTRQLAVEAGKFPKPDPIDLVTAFANALNEYGLQAFEDVTGLDLTGLKAALDRLKSLLGGIDLFDGDAFDRAEAIAQFIASIPAGLIGTDWGALLGKLTGGGGALPEPAEALDQLAKFFRINLGAPITPGRLPLLPLSHISAVNPNLLTDGGFDDEATLAPFDDWDWDDTDGRTKPGCAYTVADGTTHTIYSNAIEVGETDTLDVEAWVDWIGLATNGAAPLTVAISAYRADRTLIGGMPARVAQAGGAGDSATWQRLHFEEWPVPEDAEYVVLELTVAAWATAGIVRFDDALVRKTGTMPQSFVSGLAGALQNAADRVQGVINQVWTGITRQVLDGPKNLTDLFEVLGAIPAGNVGGVGGLGTMAATIAETWTQLWGGFARNIELGGKSIADAANAAADVAETADQAVQVGEWNNAILGIRNNKGYASGMDATGVASFGTVFPASSTPAGDPPFMTITAAAVPVAFWLAETDDTRGAVGFYCRGNANITAFYIDVYRVVGNTLTYLHTSPDLFPFLSPAASGWLPVTYNMLTANRPTVAHGDQLAFGLRLQGTGSIDVACAYGWMGPDNTKPVRRPAAQRDANTFGTIALGSLTWSGHIPLLSVSIVEGDVAPPFYAPRTTEFLPGLGQVYDIPTWAKYLDVVTLGGAGGGKGGNGGDTRPGYGGGAGLWATETLVRGVDFPANATQIVLDVGTGGAGGGKEQNGQNGTASGRRAISGGKAALVAAAGAGATQYGSGTDPNSTGRAPGNISFAGKPYVGGQGGAGGRPGGNGGDPGAGGGGGYGGIYTVGYAGGDGGRGAGWVTARST
ncbi:minor tail protein [Mycobacterium phage Lemuria]|uniref:Minor tail protein n=1 Tax=Mycobacterium phage Lemuria TaxID=2599868 RepID=A0A5J6TGM3_9CAUD|nr:minor tail protein [Mycobacterium phage Lemuria]QFG10103.1 minor tail protein [Mycobacterium phage Lemuria]